MKINPGNERGLYPIDSQEFMDIMDRGWAMLQKNRQEHAYKKYITAKLKNALGVGQFNNNRRGYGT